jgi:hypothetical protein
MQSRLSVLRLCIAIFACVLVVHPVAAQDLPAPVVIGETLEIESQILGETRQLIIGKPVSYDSGADRYPVLYLLDGEEHFVHTTGLITFLADNIRIPEILVVAIVNTDRSRDLSPPTQVEEVIDGDSVLGGADRFRSFMTRELAPWVEQNYRTTPHRVLVGHSLGGLFAIHALINEPTAFESYIAISPALGWNDQRLVAEAEAFFDATPRLDADLFMTAGNEGGSLLGGVRKLSGVLDEKAPRDFRWDFDLLGNESHQLVPHRSIYLGLEFIYSNYYLADPVSFYDENGIQGVIEFYSETDRKIPLITYANINNPLSGADRLEDMAALLSLGPDAYDPSIRAVFISGWNELARRYAEQSNDARAIEFYRLVLDADPTNKQASDGLRDLGIDAQ